MQANGSSSQDENLQDESLTTEQMQRVLQIGESASQLLNTLFL